MLEQVENPSRVGEGLTSIFYDAGSFFDGGGGGGGAPGPARYAIMKPPPGVGFANPLLQRPIPFFVYLATNAP